MTYIIEAKNITKTYTRGIEDVHAVRNASFKIKKGEIVSVTGPSGSGKTTLVNIMGCLDNPSSGSLKVDRQEIFEHKKALSETELTSIRRKFFGYIFQKFFLIPTLSVRENVLLPSVFNKKLSSDEEVITNVLKMLGLEKRANHLPSQLSGGEMQRVAVARALIGNPPILIADEPTGNLDSKRANEIKELLLKLNKEQNLTVVLVTHDQEFAKIGTNKIELLDGEIQ